MASTKIWGDGPSDIGGNNDGACGRPLVGGGCDARLPARDVRVLELRWRVGVGSGTLGLNKVVIQ